VTAPVDTREPWRLGEPETTHRATSKRARRGGESLVLGEVVFIYTGQDGELLEEVGQPCLFPVENESVRAKTDGPEMVVSFRVRGVAEGEPFEQRIEWFRANPGEWQRATTAERRRAVSSAGLVPRVELTRQLAPLPTAEAPAQPSGRRRVDYGDGRFAIVTDGDAKRVDFDDGESVTITELPESGTELPRKKELHYLVPGRFKVEIFDANGLRVGLDGTRYRPQDAMRPSAESRSTPRR
jgi:hypothetical protein